MNDTDFATPGYEGMELSTQILIAEALRRGVEVEVLDRSENFIRLKKGEVIELIKSATCTSKDSFVTSLALGNKGISKILLNEAGIRVPKGSSFDQVEAAFKAAQSFNGKKTVIKPKTTNFGIGIAILQENHSENDFTEAVNKAFQYDHSILIEEFLEGMECRFLVVDGTCLAVLHRVPANVMGDGVQTIEALIDQKNEDPRRGFGHVTPLEKIQKGEVECAVLSKKGLTMKSVPAKGQTVYLRENSNISTGGDSIDFTGKVHDSYLRLAERAAASAASRICGVDVILKNPDEAATEDNYGVIEINFNPVLYFHNFPFEGSNHHVEKAVLDLLGFPDNDR